jgi:hypothetical protein
MIPIKTTKSRKKEEFTLIDYHVSKSNCNISKKIIGSFFDFETTRFRWTFNNLKYKLQKVHGGLCMPIVLSLV